jgi:cytochrome b subunit of formate dehydrogenase
MAILPTAGRRPFAALSTTALLIAAVILTGAAVRGAARSTADSPVIENADCYGCHGDKTLETAGPDGKPRSLHVDEAVYASSIHGRNRCTSCHNDIVVVPHPEGFRPKDVSCAQCHRIETGIYLASDHGLAVHAGVGEAASCKDCHGATHTLLNSRNPASPVFRTNITKTCARCHANVAEMAKFHLRQANPVGSYEHSVHGRALVEKGALNAAVCTDCHGSHDLHKSTNVSSKLHWRNVPATCGRCHENVERTYVHSIHGKAVAQGVRDAPVCTDCHGEHGIFAVKLPESRVAPSHVPETCAQCHAARRIITQYQLPPDVMSTYVQSFHGLALKGGNPTVANCASCHGVHDIQPSSDPMSSVNPKDLPQTCGRCHPGIGTRLAAEFFKVHAPTGPHEDKPWIVNLVTIVYIVLIVLTIGGMALFVALDYGRKTRDHVRTVKADAHAEERLTPSLRRQHLVLTVLFVALAYTGFVHRFPDAFFSWPFKVMADGNALRALLHRVFGWAFVVFFTAHLGALVGGRTGRSYARALWFGWHDVKDVVEQLLYSLGRRPVPPPRRRWNYAEKAEYWALVWGSVVMIITGIMLVFTEAMLRLWPKVWNDVAQVIHFYEAVLATLAILVWHAYWVIFDPAEYPMNPAWLTGTRPSQHAHGPSPVQPAPAAEALPAEEISGEGGPDGARSGSPEAQ